MNAQRRQAQRANEQRSSDRTELDEIHSAVARRLAGCGIRYTRARRAVVDALAAVHQPLTVDQIHDAAKVPVSSVYRTIATLEAHGVAHRLTSDTTDHAYIELAEDLIGHHHHLACATCGTMIDVTLPDTLEADIDRALAGLAQRQQFTIDGHRLDIAGICARCKRSNGRRQPNRVVTISRSQ